MSDFDPERARAFTMQAIDVTASTIIANRRELADAILEHHPEGGTPEIGNAAVNMALNILAILRVHVETDDLGDASLLPPEGGATH